MRTRCKHGDLAVIIKDEPELFGVNLGRVVKVNGPVRLCNAPHDRNRGRPLWEVQPVTLDPMPFIDAESGGIKADRAGFYILHPDDWLLPIKPRRWTKIQKSYLTDGENDLNKTLKVDSGCGARSRAGFSP